MALTGAAIIGILALVLQSRRPPYFTATSVLVVDRSAAGVTAPRLLPSDYQTAVTSQAVLGGAWTRLHQSVATDHDIQYLRNLVSVQVADTPQAASIKIGARAHSAVSASQTANAIADSLLAWDAARANRALQASIGNLEAQVGELGREITALRSKNGTTSSLAGSGAALEGLYAQKASQLADLQSQKGQGRSGVLLLRSAVPPMAPSSPSIPFTTALGLLAGLLLGYGFYLFRAITTRKVRTNDELSAVTASPILADIPRAVEPAGPRSEVPAAAASYLRAYVELASGARSPCLLFGTHPGAGQVALALAMGLSFVRQGKKAVWIETGCDDDLTLRLRSLVAKESPFTMEDGFRVRYLSLRDRAMRGGARDALHLITGFCAEPRSADSLSAGLGRLIERCQAAYDVVIVSAGLFGSDAMPLTVAPHCRTSVLVADLRQSRRDEIVRATSVLRDSGTEYVGTVATHNPPLSGKVRRARAAPSPLQSKTVSR